MIIKFDTLASHLSKKLASLYMITGPDHYLQNESVHLIKGAFQRLGTCDEQVICINSPADWDGVREEANSYSLFSQLVLLDVRFDKKSLDSAGKKILQAYLENSNARCLIIVRAPAVPHKQLQWLASPPNGVQIQANPLTANAMRNFIASSLQKNGIRYQPDIPALIHQYTQHNMLAAAQVIERLSLVNDASTLFTTEDVLEHVSNQCDFPIYELADACLAADANQSILLLRQVSQNRVEPTLILWILTQEIRLLIQLAHRISKATPIATACNQLKIWPMRTRLYQMALKRLSITQLYPLLTHCQQLDEWIKSSQNKIIWIELERLALSLCFPKESTS